MAFRVIQGDAIETMRGLPPASVDAVVTDPPYFQPASHYVPTRAEGAARKTLADTSILQHFFSAFIREAFRLLKPDGSIYIFCDGQSYPIAFNGLYPFVKRVRPLVWDKVTSFNGYTWRHQHELIAWGELDDSERIATGDGDILRCPAVPVGERLHPAQKPVDLLAKLVNKTKVGGVVFDPFCGSGATGIAALRTGREFIGVELDPDYCEVARERLGETRMPLLHVVTSLFDYQTEAEPSPEMSLEIAV